MKRHLHTDYVEGCYRCILSRREAEPDLGNSPLLAHRDIAGMQEGLAATHEFYADKGTSKVLANGVLVEWSHRCDPEWSTRFAGEVLSTQTKESA